MENVRLTLGVPKPPPQAAANSEPRGRTGATAGAVVQAVAREPVGLGQSDESRLRRVEQTAASASGPGVVFVRAFAALQPMSMTEMQRLWRQVLASSGTGDAASVAERAIAAYRNSAGAEPAVPSESIET